MPISVTAIGGEVIRDKALNDLTEVSHYVAAVANQHPDPHAPYVGRSAFAHKGGIHVAAIAKVPESYRHVDPEEVGNVTRVVVSEVAGRRNVRLRALCLRNGHETARAEQHYRAAMARPLIRAAVEPAVRHDHHAGQCGPAADPWRLVGHL